MVTCVVKRKPPSNSTSKKHATHCPLGGCGHTPVTDPSEPTRSDVGLYATACGAGLPGGGSGDGDDSYLEKRAKRVKAAGESEESKYSEESEESGKE
jgi:hypothetical protein